MKSAVMGIIVLEKGETTFIALLSDHFQFFTVCTCQLPGELLAIDIHKVK